MKLKTFGLACVLAGALWAETQVGDVSLDVNAAGNFVTVSYTLTGEDAIVTLDVLTNGVSVGGAALRRVAGDVNRTVSAGTRAIWWRPGADCDVAGADVQAVVRTWTREAPPDYTAFALAGTKDRLFYTCEDALPYGIGSDAYRTGYLLLRRIPAAGRTFTMGSSPSEPACDNNMNREDAHPVSFTKDFWLGVFEFTQRQFELASPETAHGFFYTNALHAATRPADCLWYRLMHGGPNMSGPNKENAVYGVLNTLSLNTGLAAAWGEPGALINGFNFPTEAQWEFACRAGTATPLYNGFFQLNGGWQVEGVHEEGLDVLARYCANGGLVDDGTGKLVSAPGDVDTTFGTARVGSYQPNAFGLYDMLGNVFEICQDVYQGRLGSAPQVDPLRKMVGEDKTQIVARGGNAKGLTYYCRATQRVGPMSVPTGSNDSALAAKVEAAFGYGVRVMLPMGR